MLATWGCATFPKPTIDLQFAGATSLDNRITFTRASTATFFNSVGVLTSAAINEARFDYNPSTLAPQGLLIEEARTNGIRNNTMVGAVAGTPGTVPTNWASTNIGLTREIVGTGTENGVNYIDIKFSGTTTGQFGNIVFEPNNGVAASASQSWTGSAYIKVLAGATTNLSSVGMVLYYFNSTPAFLSATTAAASVTSTLTRFTVTATTPASTAFVQPAFYFTTTAPSGQAIDITLRIGLPQLEQGAFATSVIPTTTTALTRSADVASMTGTNFSSWYNASEGTFVAQYLPSAVAASTVPQSVIHVSDGTVTEQLQLYKRANVDVSTRYRVDVGGVNSAFLNLGTFTATQTKAAITYKVNDFVGIKSGGSLVTDTAGGVPAPNKMDIGTELTGLASINGYIQRITYYPTRLADAQLQALTA